MLAKLHGSSAPNLSWLQALWNGAFARSRAGPRKDDKEISLAR